ncbi:MAG: hypothetical protein UU87_C0002G0059 [Parcubacteria group bacterium GW2011_GWA2_42_11]|nr:MAG: hypothetical protein UU87_C0002G0059 [Parcubacteria group bacterium GW2011_GWA2_42_11]
MEKTGQPYQPEVPELPENPIKQKITSKLLEAYKRDLKETSERIAAYVGKIRDKYPDYENYQSYHFLAGSSPTEKPVLTDFFSPDSVEEFIETL